MFETFRKGSRTYFISSLFFPHQQRCDVFRVYAFVRIADNYVDQKPPKTNEFYAFVKKYEQAKKGKVVGEEVVDEFMKVMVREEIPSEWVSDFLSAMELDLTKKSYKTLAELEDYMYGSAEVIGLFMAKLLKLPEKSYPTAQYLGKAMQLSNFIRDIDEDNYLGRQYIPTELLKKYKIKSLHKKDLKGHESQFDKLIRACIDIYFQWQKSAEEGFRYIPKRYLIPIKTASDMYK